MQCLCGEVVLKGWASLCLILPYHSVFDDGGESVF